MQAAASLQTSCIADYYLEGGIPATHNAPAGSYDTEKGYIAITLVKEPQYLQLCQALGSPDLASNPLYATFASRAEHMDTLGPAIQNILMQKTAEEWTKQLGDAGVLCQIVAEHGDWVEDIHVSATKAFQMVPQPGMGLIPIPQIPGAEPIDPDDPRQQAPGLGRHSREILERLGYGVGRIDALISGGAVR